jgi:hypothetical protein
MTEYVLTGIPTEGIRLKPFPSNDSNGDGQLFHNGQMVVEFDKNQPTDGYKRVYADGSRSMGWIHANHLIPIIQPPQGHSYTFKPGKTHSGDIPPPPYTDKYPGPVFVRRNGGLRRRKFRSHKKHHIKKISRSKKACSRRR